MTDDDGKTRFYADFVGADPRGRAPLGDGPDMRPHDGPDSGPVLEEIVFPPDIAAPVPIELEPAPVLTGYPDGNPKTAAGMKKPDVSVIPPAGILHLATAMMNGAAKYGPFNWREKNISTRPYIAAAMRHLLSYLDGEEFSQDTIAAGVPVHHLGHVMACCAIVLDAYELGSLNDNRPLAGPSGDMIEHFNGGGTFKDREGSA